MKRFSKFSLRFLVLAVAGIVVFPHPIPVNADETAARTYRVKAGDTIAKIAADLAISPNDIIDTNNLREQGGIYVGEELKLPANTFDMTPTAHAGEDANWFFDRLRGHFDSLEEFDKIAQKAKETGVCEQAISELRLRYCIRGPEISALRETLSNFEKSLPNWKVADSVIFNNWISLDGFLHLAHGVIDQAEGDTMGYEREMKQAFWINPKDAERFGKVLVDGHARRGLILDINQKTLADNASVRTVVVDNYELNHLDEAEAALAGPLGLDTKDLDTKFGWDRKYIVIKKHVPEATAKEIEEQLKAHSVGGVTFEQETERIYPNGAVACHVVGFVNSDYEGVQGIERTEDQYLRGHDGFRLPNNHRVEPQDGCNVRLTLDLNLQKIVETEIDAACAEFKPKKAIVMLMRPQTGEILAMANRPNFDPSDLHTKAPSYLGKHEGDMKNCAITDQMEPGQTFMIVPAAGALNNHVVRPDSVIFCENGAFRYGGHFLHDYRPWGDLTVADILVKSSNIGAAKLAMRLGDQRLFGYMQAFGFGERTGVALTGEIRGTVFPPERWDRLAITRIPMGQGVAVTPIQTITAMCAIANGGKLMMPQIVHDITDAKGVVVTSFPPVVVRQVVSDETARQMTEALKGVVSPHGTAVQALVPGFAVAGKTGTAEKPDAKGGYMSRKYIVSFCGFLPAENPAFVCLVLLDDPVTKPDQCWGGTVAAPIFSRIAEKVVHYMNLTPPDPTPTLPLFSSAAGTSQPKPK